MRDGFSTWRDRITGYATGIAVLVVANMRLWLGRDK